ncbi:hypothetical protein ACFFRR_011167 [Megaselia abdita]
MDTNFQENSNIKEKLNLHVKRRLQESDDVSFPQFEDISVAAGSLSQESSSPTTKAKVKKSLQKAKKSKVPKIDEDSLSNAEKEEAAESPNQFKDKQPKESIFDVILNAKKVSLMKDPDVIEFFKNMSRSIKKE